MSRMLGNSAGFIIKSCRNKNVDFDLSKGESTIDSEKHVATDDLKEGFRDYPKYLLSEISHKQQIITPTIAEDETKS